jgi:hypothetical protein
MGHHVDLRVRPIDERSIHPNFSLWLKHRYRRQSVNIQAVKSEYSSGLEEASSKWARHGP